MVKIEKIGEKVTISIKEVFKEVMAVIKNIIINEKGMVEMEAKDEKVKDVGIIAVSI